MIEAMTFFCLGYAVSFFINRNSPNFKKPDRILKWDDSIFAWRPLVDGSFVKKDEVILFAYEMKKETLRES